MTSQTSPTTVEAGFAGARSGVATYSDLRIESEDVYNTWPRQTGERLISLRDAAIEVYDRLPTNHWWSFSAKAHGQGDANAILSSLATKIAKEIEIYGQQPPGTATVPLGTVNDSHWLAENGATTIRSTRLRMPACENLKVKKRQLDALVEQLKDGLQSTTPS